MNDKPVLIPSRTLPPLNVQQYERYNPTAFNDSLTILEKMNKMIYQLNSLGEISNNIVAQWNDLIKWILGDGLNEIVEEEIQKKIDDGTFDNLFNSILGDLSLLETIDKSTIVNAINEVNRIAVESAENIGIMSDLKTDNKGTLVEAINEIKEQESLNKQSTIMIAESTGYGVIKGLEVTQQRVLSMAVDIGMVGENIIHMKNGNRFVLDGVSLPIDQASTTEQRIDLLYVSGTGSIEYLKGVPSLVNPSPPIVPVDGVELANVLVVANDTTINNSDITDLRPLKSLSFLKTDYKKNLVGSINEVLSTLNTEIDGVITSFNNGLETLGLDLNGKIGTLSLLDTVVKTDLVSSINEVIQSTYEKIADLETVVYNDIGDLKVLDTTFKDNLVGAINEVISDTTQSINDLETKIMGVIGDLSLLVTTDKTSVVNALNELASTVNNDIADAVAELTDKIGNLSLLKTTAKDSLVSSVNEVYDNVGLLSQLETTSKDSLVSSVNELYDTVGLLSQLETARKDSIVSAINSLNEKFDESEVALNVKQFGAIGDGLADDSQAFQDAIDYTLSVKGKLIVPHGTYLLTKTINITGAGFILIEGLGGAERISNIITNFNGDVFSVDANYFVTIKGINILHSGNLGSCVNFVKGESHQLIDCTLENVLGNTGHIVQFYHSNYRIVGCWFNNFEPSAYCIRASKAINGLSINAYIDACYFAGTGKGVLIDSENPNDRLEGLKVVNNVFINTGSEQITVATVLDVDISGNMLDQGSFASILISPAALLVDTVRISNNYISPAKNDQNGIAIYIPDNSRSARNITITGNRFGWTGYGVVTNVNTGVVTITDNVFASCEHSAIQMNGTQDVIITSNQFVVNSFDLSLTDGAIGGDFIVANNQFTSEILLNITNPNKFLIENNSGYKNRSVNTVEIVPVEGTQYIAINHGLKSIPPLYKCFASVTSEGSGCEFGGLWIIEANADSVTIGFKTLLVGSEPTKPKVTLFANL